MDADSTERLSIWQWLLGKILQLYCSFLLTEKISVKEAKNQQTIPYKMKQLKYKVGISKNFLSRL